MKLSPAEFTSWASLYNNSKPPKKKNSRTNNNTKNPMIKYNFISLFMIYASLLATVLPAPESKIWVSLLLHTFPTTVQFADAAVK